MSIAQKYLSLREHIGEQILLVCVTKGCAIEAIREAYDAGCRDFGESRVKEALEKKELLPKDIRWHYIGKLQKNKVAKIVGKFALIHSVDSFELAKKISEESIKLKVETSALLEVNTSGEATKGGLSYEEWLEVFPEVLKLKGLNIKGLMTMAPLTDDKDIVRHAFMKLRHLRDELNHDSLKILSMGMSSDYEIAIEEGSNLLRIGSYIFKS